MAEQVAFSEWLAEVRKGDLDVELTEQMADLMRAVVAHDKKGSLTLTFKFEPASDEMGIVRMLDDIKIVTPTANRSKTVWFVTESYGLSRRNPAQMELGETLPEPGTALGEIPNDAAE